MVAVVVLLLVSKVLTLLSSRSFDQVAVMKYHDKA